MKKGIAILLVMFFCIAWILPMPAHAAQNAVADKEYFIKSLENISYPEVANNQFTKPGTKLAGKFSLDSNISVQDKDSTFSSLCIKGGVDYTVDMAKYQGQFDVSMSGKLDDTASHNNRVNIDSSIYWDRDKLFITGETLKELADIFGEELPVQCPQYVYQDFNEDTLVSFEEQLQQSQNFYKNYPGYNDFRRQLLTALIMPVPAGCFSKDGNTAVLSMDKRALVLYLCNMNDKAFIDSLLKVFQPLFPELTSRDLREVFSDIAESSEESLLKELENLDIKELRITISGSQITVNCRISCKIDGDIIDFTLSSHSNGSTAGIDFKAAVSVDSLKMDMALEGKNSIANSIVNQDATFRFGFSEKSDYLQVSADCKSKMQDDQTAGNGTFDVKAKFSNESLNMKATINYTAKVKENLQLNVPRLNSSNSLSLDELFPEDQADYEDELIIVVDGDWMEMEEGVAPFIQNGRTMVPLRSIGEYLGCDVEWIPPNQINMSYGNTLINLKANNNTYQINSATKTLDAPPVIVNGRTYVPLRVVGEAFDYNVEYDADLGIIYLDRR